MTNQDSRVARVLKAKYYPLTDFLPADMGHRPSPIWRSFCEAKQLLKAGTRWIIGNGESVKIWKDSWFPRERSFNVHTKPKSGREDWCVSELIDAEKGIWRKEVMEELFEEEEKTIILKMPLSSAALSDSHKWHYTKDGQFTVKSAYHLALTLKEFNQGGTSSSGGTQRGGIWKKIWSLELPRKLKTFVWKINQNILPTLVVLDKRLKGIDQRCPMCKLELETISHILFTCKEMKEVWDGIDVGCQKIAKCSSSFEEFLLSVDGVDGDQGVEKAIMGAWTCWGLRNKWVFDNKKDIPRVD